MNHTILIVDDEKEIANLVAIHLQNEGYKTLQAHNGEHALQLLQTQNIDLLMLDIMMPQMSGHEVIAKVRQNNALPIIFLSARTSDFDKISGLVMGADDYITKPFNPLELVARVNAQLRRSYTWATVAKQTDELHIQDVTIRKDERLVFVGQQRIELTPKEFDILFLLAQSPQQVFSAEQIFEQVWQEAYFEAANTVMVHIRTLRKKLQEVNRTQKLIETVWGVGYRLNA